MRALHASIPEIDICIAKKRYQVASAGVPHYVWPPKEGVMYLETGPLSFRSSTKTFFSHSAEETTR